jgi:hypothetical protein
MGLGPPAERTAARGGRSLARHHRYRALLIRDLNPEEGPERWTQALRRLRAAPGDTAARAMFGADNVMTWEPKAEDLPLPSLRFLLDWWKGRAAREGGLPSAAEPLDPLVLRPALGVLMTMDVLPGATDFRYRLFGTVVAQRSGFDLTGKLVTEVPGPHDGVVWFLATYGAAALEAAPLYTEHTPWSAMSVTRWYRLILPLGGPDGTVQRFVIGNVPGETRLPSNEVMQEIVRAASR